MTNESSATGASEARDNAVEVGAEDLPLHCPTKQVALWASHPRVFLDITVTGRASCPYCGTKYKLKDGVVIGHH